MRQRLAIGVAAVALIVALVVGMGAGEDSSGDYFMPQNIDRINGTLEGIVFSPGPEVIFTYSYGKDSPVRFKRVNDPVTITLTLNQ